MTNRQKAIAVIESIGTMNHEPIGYINPQQYIQHNLGVGDGLEGFGAVAAQLPAGSYGKVIRAIEDGDFVVLHSEYDFFGPKVGFDIFRFEDGLIVEHWDNLAELVQQTASGRSQLDGEASISDHDKTESNKAVVKGFVDDVLFGGAPQKIANYISTTQYLQHNPHVADGLDALGTAMKVMAASGKAMVYKENHMLLGEGNFVLSASEGLLGQAAVSYYDLFRLADGLIVEHWDVIELIPEKSEWKNNNGKF